MSCLSSRERVLIALNHREPDRVPVAYGFFCTPEAAMKLKEHLGILDDNLLLERLGIDTRWISPEYVGPQLRTFADGSLEDIWGVIRKPMSYAKGHYNEIIQYPLAKSEDVAALDRFRWPKTEWWDFGDMEKRIKSINDKQEYAIVMGNGNIFESSWYMRGLENMFCDLTLNPELAYEIMGRVTDYFIDFFKKALEAAKGKIDIVFTADDIGGQDGLTMSLPMWTKYIKPHHVRMNKVLRGFGVRIMYHTDGAVMSAIPDLIDMGVDILSPLQFSAKGMSDRGMKEQYGDKLCFHGGIDTQTSLPFGTVEDIRMEVRNRIKILGKNGGYLLCSCHAVQVDTSPENIMAMFDTALNHRY